MQNEPFTVNGGKIPYFESSTQKNEENHRRITPEIRKPTVAKVFRFGEPRREKKKSCDRLVSLIQKEKLN